MIISDFRLYHGGWVSKVAPHDNERISKELASCLLRGGVFCA